eukprot:CAMPEP_0184487354 /NCGR_PEP_ID=MMETSP0113_2-20130426/9868_1 /TAXON_ID=91329 /ORGANISM="Norrisiella sphaerica, Strain BC52" /LENGTH=176 /DNA_ID=CAMNT_0026869633 /DNA_START=156 /DNA_END=683 /DNA_ORIENTATION=-
MTARQAHDLQLLSSPSRRCLRAAATGTDGGTDDEDINPYAKLQMEAQKQRELDENFSQDSIDIDFGFSFNGVKESVDSFLIADFFFICASLVWLAAGVVAKFVLKTEAIYEAWYALWTPIFQPALGLLMAGALVSGLGGWLDEQKDGNSSPEKAINVKYDTAACCVFMRGLRHEQP